MVYAIQCLDTGRVKIGFSKHPEKRMVQIAQSGPTRLVLAGVTGGGKDVESDLHRRLCDSRVSLDGMRSREWFYPTRQVVEWVDSIGGKIVSGHVPQRVMEWTEMEYTLTDSLKAQGRAIDILTHTIDAVHDVVEEWDAVVRLVQLMKYIHGGYWSPFKGFDIAEGRPSRPLMEDISSLTRSLEATAAKERMISMSKALATRPRPVYKAVAEALAQ